MKIYKENFYNYKWWNLWINASAPILIIQSAVLGMHNMQRPFVNGKVEGDCNVLSFVLQS